MRLGLCLISQAQLSFVRPKFRTRKLIHLRWFSILKLDWEIPFELSNRLKIFQLKFENDLSSYGQTFQNWHSDSVFSLELVVDLVDLTFGDFFANLLVKVPLVSFQWFCWMTDSITKALSAEVNWSPTKAVKMNWRKNILETLKAGSDQMRDVWSLIERFSFTF